MKQVLALALVLVIALSLISCKRSEVAQMGTTLDDWASPELEKKPQKVDVAAYIDADFSKELGIEVVSLPPEDQMSANKFFVLDKWYGQIEFTSEDNLSLNVRLAKADSPRLSTTFHESHIFDEQEIQIDGLNVTIARAKEGCVLICWERGGVQYALHSNKVQGMPPEKDIETIVKWLDCILISTESS